MLELDPELVEIAVRDLGLDRDEIDRIAVGDARLTLATTPEDAFELVVAELREQQRRRQESGVGHERAPH